jgi:hypothetical protein
MHPGPTSLTIPSQPGFLNRARGPGGGHGARNRPRQPHSRSIIRRDNRTPLLKR